MKENQKMIKTKQETRKCSCITCSCKARMPLKRFVIDVTNEAVEGDKQSVSKALRSYHNRLANGSIPRSLFVRIGKQLFVDLEAFEVWASNGGSDQQKQI